MTFKEFFDPHNVDHIAEYGYLQIKGYWRKGFIPDDVELTPMHFVEALEVMALAWIRISFTDETLREIAEKMDA